MTADDVTLTDRVRLAEVSTILECLPMDEHGTGHIVDCGWDDAAESPTCGCYTLPGRIRDAVERILADRLAAVQAEVASLREVLRIGTELDNHHNADACPYCTGGVMARAESAERRLAEAEAVTPDACWVTHATGGVRCSDLIGGEFPNGSAWTAEMCCLPCRLRAALANPSALAQHDAEVGARARDAERADWSSWLDNWLSAIGPKPPTVEMVARALREGPRPFGCARADALTSDTAGGA